MMDTHMLYTVIISVAGASLSFLVAIVVALIGWFTNNTLANINQKIQQKEVWINDLQIKTSKHAEALASYGAKDNADNEKFHAVQAELSMVREKLSEVEKMLIGMVSRMDVMMKTGSRRKS